MIAIACPGQGSQAPGFLEPWLDIPTFKSQLERSSEIVGLDLIHYGTEADSEEIRDTKIAQPLIVAAGIASYLVMVERFGKEVFTATAGHSVGEVTAAFVSEIFDDETALKFVLRRGNEMATAAAQSPSSMAAVIGGEPETVVSHLEANGLSAANFNGGGQIVAAGALDKVAALVSSPPTGTRVVQLQVAGAFHTSFMESAKASLLEYSNGLKCSDPKISIWTNRDGGLVKSGVEFRHLLVNQVSSPVRWDKTMDAMTKAGVSTLIELLPAGALTGLAKRAMPDTLAIAVKTPADLDKVAEALGE